MSSNSSTNASDDVRAVAELLKDQRFGMLTTIAADGTLMSRPLAMQDVDFDGDLWFFVAHDSRAVAQVQAEPRVNVSLGSGSTWISLAGTASVVDDVAKKRDMWDTSVEAWFPDGPESADVVLLHVDAHSAEYWNTPGGRLSTLFSFAKAKVTGQPLSGGENERVDL